MHQALYRKWRPRNFDEVSGQEHITSILKYQCERKAFSHAYLFCGSRGTGKTSCAKILAKAVNCANPTAAGPCGNCAACRAIDAGSATDVLEMDAASNNGVDDIRDIRDEVIYAPSELTYRVYIIDEVHMLSPSAFNALLKTLEEPPAHVIFILATTELQKLPATIISRCQRFDFRRIATEDLTARLRHIAAEEQLTLDDDAARLIARQAQGGMRDAISLLELCAGARVPITADLVADTIGSTGREGMTRVTEAIVARDYDTLFAVIDDMVRSSRDLAIFWQELINFYRDMLVIRATKKAAAYLDLTDAEQASLTATAAKLTKETLLYHTKLLEDALFAMQKAHAVKRTVAELTLVRMCDPSLDVSNEALLSRISRLEERMAAGVASPTPETAAVSGSSPTPTSDPSATPTPAPAAVDRTPVAHEGQTKNNDSTAAAPSAADPAKRVLRPLRNWPEVVDRVRNTSPMAASFLKQAKAYTTETGDVVIKFRDEFQRDMSRQEGAPEALRMALSVAANLPVTSDRIHVEVDAAKTDGPSAMDEILDALDEDTTADR